MVPKSDKHEGRTRNRGDIVNHLWVGAWAMATHILGISAFYHDSAAALLRDGRIVAAAQEERFSRKKHDHRLPRNAVEYCLREAGITPLDLDYVGFYDKPNTKFERLLETHQAFAPVGFSTYLKSVPLWLKSKLHLSGEIDAALAGLGGQYRGRYVFSDHHESHAASAFFPSPFDEAAILTLDGVGEWSTTTMGVGRGNKISLTHEIRFPHSIGLLYSAFTYYTGFRVNSGEYKVMGLAPYGEPRFRDLILENVIDVKEDGSFWMDMSYFNYCQGMTMTSEKFHRLFGGPPRKPEDRLTDREMDLAASVQVVCEEVMLRCARHLQRTTGQKNLVLAGGVALNCVGNGRIFREGPFDDMWIQPASGDAGGALGVAQLIWHHVLGQPRTPEPSDSQSGSLLGPQYSDDEILRSLDVAGAKYQRFDSDEAIARRTAELLADGKVVGVFQGRMEFGPRALGSRSILGDPRSEKMQQVMNLKIKFRESFRPFAPAVLREHVHEWFDVPPGYDSPYMLLVSQVHASQLHPEAAERMVGLTGIEMLNVPRSTIPAITHVDNSARIQTVDSDRHPDFHRLLTQFHAITKCPVLINTSFNIRGEPIVCTPQDAYRCFMGTFIDVLVMGRTMLLKEEQPDAQDFDMEAYRAQFQLD
jgi:carbamoyltransferase